MMFLAHFSHTGYDAVLEMPLSKLQVRIDQAIELHNEMNKQQDG